MAGAVQDDHHLHRRVVGLRAGARIKEEEGVIISLLVLPNNAATIATDGATVLSILPHLEYRNKLLPLITSSTRLVRIALPRSLKEEI